MLSFDEAGQRGGTPLILIHGWCCNRRHMAGLSSIFRNHSTCSQWTFPDMNDTHTGHSGPLRCFRREPFRLSNRAEFV